LDLGQIDEDDADLKESPLKKRRGPAFSPVKAIGFDLLSNDDASALH